MEKKPNQEREARRHRREKFPESNRFWRQIRILMGAQVPMLGAMVRNWRLALRGRLAAGWNKFRSAFERKRLPAPVFLAAAALITVPAVFFSLFTWGTTVLYDGQAVGTVATASAADTAVAEVEQEVSGVLGDSFTLDESLVSYSSGLVSRRSVVDTAAVESNLSDELNLTTYAYSL